MALVNSEGRLICSGTMIDPQVVVTAAHCVEETASDNHIAGIHVGSGAEGGALHVSATVREQIRHPEFNSHPRGNMDIGILFLASSIEAEVAQPVPLMTSPAQIRRQFLHPDITKPDSSVKLVGFGRREDDGAGIKFEVTTTIAQANASEILVGGHGKDSCTGDSGGPVLTGHGELLGVISRGSTIACGNGGIATVVADAGCWIQSVAADRGIHLATALPCGDPVRQMRALEQVLGTSMQNAAVDGNTVLDLSDWYLESLDGIADMIPDAIAKASNDKCLVKCPLHEWSMNLKGNHLESFAAVADLEGLRRIDIAFNNIENREIELARKSGITVFGGRLQINNFLNTKFMEFCAPFDDKKLENDPRDPDAAAANLIQLQALRARFATNRCDAINRRLVKSTRLNLKGRKLTSLSLLQDLPLLRELDVSDNPILDYSAALTMERLTVLNVSGNPHLTGDAQISTLNQISGHGVRVINQLDAP